MFDFLFNGTEMINATKSILITAGVIIIIILVLKILEKTGTFTVFFKSFFKVCSVLLFVALSLSGVYSYFYINAYYKSYGGIWGNLTSTVYNSIQLATPEEQKDSMIYSFDNLVFKTDDDGKYSIVFTKEYTDDEVRTKFLEGTKYSIFVLNDGDKYECNDISYDNDWIHAKYSYIFYGSYQEEDVIGSDTLTFDFCFYKNYSYLKITSDADASIIQLWNAYFNKYDFQVSIDVVDDVFIPNDADNILRVNFYLNKTKLISNIILPVSNNTYTITNNQHNTTVIEGATYYNDGEMNYRIRGWLDKNGNKVETISLSESTTINLYADTSVTIEFYDENGSELLNTKTYGASDEIDYYLDYGLKEGFQGWTYEALGEVAYSSLNSIIRVTSMKKINYEYESNDVIKLYAVMTFQDNIRE